MLPILYNVSNTKGNDMISMTRKFGDFEVREEWIEDYNSFMFVVYDRGIFHMQVYSLAEAVKYAKIMNNYRIMDKRS